MKTQDKIVSTLLVLLIFISHAFYPVGKMFGYNMPFFSVTTGMLGTLGVIMLAIIYLIWRKL